MRNLGLSVLVPKPCLDTDTVKPASYKKQSFRDKNTQAGAWVPGKTRLVNEKGDLAEDVSDYIVRSRSVVKGLYGSDSSEYDMVGGTRDSERKKGKRKEEGED